MQKDAFACWEFKVAMASAPACQLNSKVRFFSAQNSGY